MRRYDDPVEVRKGQQQGPEQFLWHGRLWQVREVVAHWVETGAWWLAREGSGPAGALPGDLLREREVWRVSAARGRSVHAEQDPGFGVFDLVFDWDSGDWRLAAAVD